MPSFQTFNLGNALTQGGNIRSARNRNALAEQQLDPNSMGNQLSRERLTGERQRNVMAQNQESRTQTKFSQEQKDRNTKLLYQGMVRISEDPSSAAEVIPELQRIGAVKNDLDYKNLSPEELKSRAVGLAEAVGKSLGIKPIKDNFTLGQGQTRFDKSGQQIASVAPKAIAPKSASSQETTLEKETIKRNVKRLSELSQNQRQRSESVKKARKFLKAFTEGKKSSGAGRRALSYVPGVYTDQAQFDEELDAFAEIAARQKLKATGEIRPTDADVKGMKQALFGIGRDEKTNIVLLEQFISEMEGTDSELSALKEAKRAGQLSSFSGGQEITNDLPQGTVDNGDGTFTLPNGQKIRKSNANP